MIYQGGQEAPASPECSPEIAKPSLDSDPLKGRGAPNFEVMRCKSRRFS